MSISKKTKRKKTLKAYRIDITQFQRYMMRTEYDGIKNLLSSYITYLHKEYKPKTVKRKLASIKAFFYMVGIRRNY
uniref:site-specific integrase n=1 Tax=Clostridium sp. NkU-1 TaxID=1095009 RepID=UPI003260831C